MFAVPGWSLSPALLKSQVDTPQDTNEPQKASKKRKRRNNEKGSVQVTNSNVADLWKEHVEGIKPVPRNEEKSPGSTKRVKITKKEKSDNAPSETHQAGKDINHSKENGNLLKKQKSQKDVLQQSQTKEDHVTNEITKPSPKASPAVKTDSKPEPKLTPLQAAMKQKLISARFRHLNQTLYTAPSTNTLTLFETNPTFFEEYHSGFRQQVSAWPENPVDSYVEELKQRGKVREQKNRRKPYGPSQIPTSTANNDDPTPKQPLSPLPRTEGTSTIADLGCGDAKLAHQLRTSAKKLHLHLLSYDLQSPNPMVTKADISNLPLAAGKVNVAIFCLALMGTNWVDFIDEAWRILRWKGELWVAEIKSRFGRPNHNAAKRVVEHSVGNKRKKVQIQKKEKEDEEQLSKERLTVEVDGAENNNNKTDVSAFVAVLRAHGFELSGDGAVDLSNKMFVKMRFAKSLSPVKGKNVQVQVQVQEGGVVRKGARFLDKSGEREGGEEGEEGAVLKPCLYKVR